METSATSSSSTPAPPAASMRLQLAINVDNLDTAIDFYSKMFDTAPLKVKPGYANFAIANPPLKFILFEGAGADGSINHLGVEVETADQVVAAEERLREAGLETTGVDETICCFAEKAETWLNAPDGNRWEWYVKKADVDQMDFAMIGDSASSDTAPNAGPDVALSCSESVCC